MTKRLPVFALILALALVAAACSSDSEDTTTTAAPTTTQATTTQAPTTTAASTTTQAPTTTTAGPTTLIIGTTDTISSLDPRDAYATRDWEAIRNISTPLVEFKPGTADELVPGIATDLGTISDDGLTYTYTLRDDIFFGDGLQLTNTMYVEQIQALLSQEIQEAAPNAVGATLGIPYVESITASGDSDIVFQLVSPVAFFPQIITSAAYVPTHPDIFPADELNVFPSEVPIYGVGPWTITEFVPQEQMVLEPNEYYFGDAPGVDRIIVRNFETPQSMADAVRAGEIDVAWRILGIELATQMGEVDGLNLGLVTETTIRYLIVNHAEGFVTADPNVRKALAALIDRDEISDVVFGGEAPPLYSQVPPGFLGANEAFDDAYGSPDPALANEFLAASGYDEDNQLQLDFAWPPEHYGATTNDAMLLIVDQLEASGVIEINPIIQEWSTYISAVVGGETWPLSMLGWFFDFPDPENYLQPWIEFGGIGTQVTDREGNLAPSVSQDLLDLLAAQRGETDIAARAAIIEELQDVYADEVVTIPLFVEPEYIVYRDGITGNSAFPVPELLNIGPTMDFNYELLNISG
jgi:peptide/nickel transport system substrate-binding protein